MFQFALDDGPLGIRYKQGKPQRYRMSGLRHNPYVGSFHGKNFQTQDSSTPTQLIIENSKSNPLIGVFRHSPSLPSKSLGLKSILYGGMTRPPIVSQLQVPREVKQLPPYNFLRSLRQIPTKKYSASSVASKSERSSSSPNQLDEDENLPTCSICLNPYADGDELRTFACSHCFHNDCVSKWIFHRCLDNDDLNSFNCPECRQNHITLSEAGSSRTSLAEGISSLSFLQVGENMAREGGYDFLSDFGSDLQSPTPYTNPSSPRPFSANSIIASGENSPGYYVADVGVISLGGNIGAPILHSEGIASRSKLPASTSAGMGATFGTRLSVLNRSSNRLLGIFPVPEESGYCMNDSVFNTSAAAASTPSPSMGSSTSACTNSSTSESSLFGDGDLLVHSTCSTGASDGTHTTGGSASPTNRSPLRSAAQDPLRASGYSDCGVSLSRM